MIEKEFNVEKLYNGVVHFYIDKKGYTAEQANRIAQKVVIRETQRRRCDICNHMSHDHLANTKTCLYVGCQCRKFVKRPQATQSGGRHPGSNARPDTLAPRAPAGIA